MIRIAYVINYLKKGGPTTVIQNIIHNLDDSVYEPVLITLFDHNDNEIVNIEKKKGVKVIECNYPSKLKTILFKNDDYVNILIENNINIVHGHGFIPDIINSKLTKWKCFKTVTTIHNILFQDYPLQYGHIKGYFYSFCHLLALKRIDAVIGCSKAVSDKLSSFLNNCLYIENGISDFNFSKAVSRKDFDIPEDAIVFLFAGNFNNRKRPVFLVENFIKYHGENEYLILLGHGEEEKKCRRLADSHVKFMGFQFNPYQYMNISDIYTSASLSEGFSISVLEALHCGMGLFLSDIPSFREVIDGTDKVYLGEYFNDNNFSVQYRKIISNRFRLNKSEIKDYQQRYLSAKSMASAYANVYESLIQSK